MEQNSLHLIGIVLVFLSALIGGFHFIVSAIFLVVGTVLIFFPDKMEEWVEEYRNLP